MRTANTKVDCSGDITAGTACDGSYVTGKKTKQYIEISSKWIDITRQNKK